MRFHSTVVLASLAALASADNLETNEVPGACRAICAPMVTLTTTCDHHDHRRLARRDHDDDDATDRAEDMAERQCVCENTSFNVRSVAALCAACIAQNGRQTDDMDEVMSKCGFASTTYADTATTAVASITVSATRPALLTTTGGVVLPTQSSGTGGQSAGARLNGGDAARYGLAVAGVLALAFSTL